MPPSLATAGFVEAGTATNKYLEWDATNDYWKAVATSGIAGSGTDNFLSKWTNGGDELTSSLISDNGSTVSISNGALLLSGITGTTPASGTGTCMMWIPAKKAFRAGEVLTAEWDDASIGMNSVAFGYNTVATGYASTAMGELCTASDSASVSMGSYSQAYGAYSIAIGEGPVSSGDFSTAIGRGTMASAYASTAFGNLTRATADYATAFGNDTRATGINSTSMGKATSASGSGATAMGDGVRAMNAAATAMGFGTTASGPASTAIGFLSGASGNSSAAIGWQATAIGSASIALGKGTQAGGDFSTALGMQSAATGNTSTAMGYLTYAPGQYATSMGNLTTSGGYASTSMGDNTTASGDFSTSTGRATIASGTSSTAMGDNTTASGHNSTALGNYVSTDFLTGSFIYGDLSTFTTLQNTAAHQFMVRAAGGVVFYTSSDLSTGVTLDAGTSAWATVSDSNRKENRLNINGDDVLNKLGNIWMGSWNYKGHDQTQHRHYGPMAQEFFAAFGNDGIGIIGNDTTLATADVDGVTLIAIKALIERTRSLEERIHMLEALLNEQHSSRLDE